MLVLTMTGWWCNNHLEKYESPWERLFPYIMESNKCSKPPTSDVNVDNTGRTLFLTPGTQKLPHPNGTQGYPRPIVIKKHMININIINDC